MDLDGTLAHYEGWGDGSIGKPIPKMVDLVKGFLASGQTVKIFTARMHAVGAHDLSTGLTITREEIEGQIKSWCREHIGQELEVTNVKDFGMITLYDDRCVQVIPNTGILVQPPSA